MGLVKLNESILTAIANAIRTKLGVQTTYKPGQMADAIASIQTPALETKSITENGTYTPSTGKNGFSSVTVTVPNSYEETDEGKVVSEGALVSQTSVTKNANGTYDTTLNNEVVVAVPQPSGNINITDMQSTNVAAYATAQVVDSDLVAGNIKKDVEILGVTGTYEGSGGGGNGLEIVQKYAEDMKRGYIISSGQFIYSTSSDTLCDVWEVVSGHVYLLMRGATVGDSFRTIFTTSDVTAVTSSVSGSFFGFDQSSVVPYTCAVNPRYGYPFTAPSNGYLIHSKTSENVTGLPCYLIDITLS